MMAASLLVSETVLKAIRAHGESAYPEEGAGLLLGKEENGRREVLAILPLTNSREDAARHNKKHSDKA